MTTNSIANQQKFPFVLDQLPYERDALSPYLSVEMFEYHYDKHHNTYLVNLNNLIANDPIYHDMTLRQVVLQAHRIGASGIFNNAAQVWNHTFYWHSMKNSGGGMPNKKFLAVIEGNFGSFEKMIAEFKTAAGHFGSAWIWLVKTQDNNLAIRSTSNADVPFTDGGDEPLIACDIWEHAYYIDFRNKRADYVGTFLEHLVNWEFAANNYFA